MQTENEQNQQGYKYYIVSATSQPCLMKVRHQDVNQFLFNLGDLVVGVGDTIDEAYKDYERRKRGIWQAWVDRWAEKGVDRGNDVRRMIADLWDRIKGEG